MAFAFSVNNTPANGAAAMFIFKTLAKANGWTVSSSSDGTTYNSSGDQITTNTSGAGGMKNASAWFCLTAPTALGITGKQICFQINATPGTSAASWRITYSPTLGFVSGTPGATRVPTAVDSCIVQGGGSDAAPTFAGIFGTDGGYRYNCGVNSATGAFYAMAFPSGGGTASYGMLFDFVTVVNALDTDPYIFGCTPTAVAWAAVLTGCYSSYGAVYSNAGSVLTCATEPANLTIDSFTSKDFLIAPRFYKSTFMFKGQCTSFYIDTVAHSTPTLTSLATSQDSVLVGSWVLPWNGGAITI